MFLQTKTQDSLYFLEMQMHLYIHSNLITVTSFEMMNFIMKIPKKSPPRAKVFTIQILCVCYYVYILAFLKMIFTFYIFIVDGQ